MVSRRQQPQTALTQGGKVHSCLGDPTTAAAAATSYVGAFQAIHNLFVRAGATNVSFVWSIDPTAPCTKKSCWTAYDPGANYVDWYGADAYSQSQPAPTLATEFGSLNGLVLDV